MKIIGICGQAGSGKDTVSDILIGEGLVHSKHALADGVRFLAKEFFDADLSKKTQDLRCLLQRIGMGMREIEPDVWCEYLERKVNRIKTDKPVIVSDVRFINEAQWLLDNGHTIVVIRTNDKNRKKRIEKRDGYKIRARQWKSMNQHPSETQPLAILRLWEYEWKALYEPHQLVCFTNDANADDCNLIEIVAYGLYPMLKGIYTGD